MFSRQRDGFVNGGVICDADDEKLANPDAENITGFVIEPALAQLADPMVEETPMTDHGEHDAIEKGPVGGGDPVAPGVSIYEGFGVEMALRPGA